MDAEPFEQPVELAEAFSAVSERGLLVLAQAQRIGASRGFVMLSFDTYLKIWARVWEAEERPPVSAPSRN
jgi:hypothetical protein